jgi:hypothetical protein
MDDGVGRHREWGEKASDIGRHTIALDRGENDPAMPILAVTPTTKRSIFGRGAVMAWSSGRGADLLHPIESPKTPFYWRLPRGRDENNS